ncbi:hypothetical protein Plhal304r1_c009g0035961 [Plasmopara halstedii]
MRYVPQLRKKERFQSASFHVFDAIKRLVIGEWFNYTLSNRVMSLSVIRSTMNGHTFITSAMFQHVSLIGSSYQRVWQNTVHKLRN